MTTVTKLKIPAKSPPQAVLPDDVGNLLRFQHAGELTAMSKIAALVGTLDAAHGLALDTDILPNTHECARLQRLVMAAKHLADDLLAQAVLI
ncbi:MAG: hypothetical protein AB7P31_13640 [Steroidobacteraceae bacterium]